MDTNIVQQRPYYNITHLCTIYRVGTYHVSINPERDQSSGTTYQKIPDTTYHLPTYIPTYIFSITTYRMVPTYIPMVPNPKKGPRNMQDLGFSVFERFYIHMYYKGSPK